MVSCAHRVGRTEVGLKLEMWYGSARPRVSNRLMLTGLGPLPDLRLSEVWTHHHLHLHLLVPIVGLGSGIVTVCLPWAMWRVHSSSSLQRRKHASRVDQRVSAISDGSGGNPRHSAHAAPRPHSKYLVLHILLACGAYMSQLQLSSCICFPPTHLIVTHSSYDVVHSRFPAFRGTEPPLDRLQ